MRRKPSFYDVWGFLLFFIVWGGFVLGFYFFSDTPISSATFQGLVFTVVITIFVNYQRT